MRFLKIKMKESGDTGFLIFPGTSDSCPFAGFCLLRKGDGDIYYPSKLDDAGSGKFWPSPLEFGDCRFPLSENEFEVLQEAKNIPLNMSHILYEMSVVVDFFSELYGRDRDEVFERKLRAVARVISRYVEFFNGDVSPKEFISNIGFDVNPN